MRYEGYLFSDESYTPVHVPLFVLTYVVLTSSLVLCSGLEKTIFVVF